MPKRESELKSAFFQELRKTLPQCYVLHHSTRAAPDYSVSGYGRTIFLEFKHGTPFFDSPGDQELMCCRLAVAGYCRYVIWREDVAQQRTLVVHPTHVHDRSLAAEVSCIGFDHVWLVSHVKTVLKRGLS